MTASIRIRGARTHNLAGVDIDLPRGELVVFAGVSGSGKSSLVLDTIAAEAGYQVNENYPPFVRNRLPRWTRPDVDLLAGLSPVVVIDQRPLGGNARSTVGTITDAYTYLRLLFSRLSDPYLGESNHFSFNDPAGMCPTCSGLGRTLTTDLDRILEGTKSLREGAILLPGYGTDQYAYKLVIDTNVFDPAQPLCQWTNEHRQALLYTEAAQQSSPLPRDYEGIVDRFERIYLHTEDDPSERKQVVLQQFTRTATCPDCGGQRLRAPARTATVLRHTITALSAMEIDELAALVATIDNPRVAPAVAALHDKLAALTGIGLGYLSLDRPTTTLSGGESQRIKTVRHLGSSLVELLYVFDEPTVGLHPHDVAPLIELLKSLRDKGNTILVVEHDPAVMAAADRIVELGPAGGSAGGRVVFEGEFAGLRTADTPTARALCTRNRQHTPRVPTGKLRIDNATRNNLRNLTVDIPNGVLTVLTGVAGSGKSSLVAEFVAQHPATIVDQRAVTTNRRSAPLTYTGIAPAVRRLFARRHGVSPKLFSANSAGACPACRGTGVIHTDLAFMQGQETRCEACDGRRFAPDVLTYTVDGMSIADIDDLTVTEATHRLPHPEITRALGHLVDVGLGYLRLGEPLTDLSGGECQRLKIAKELTRPAAPTLYVLDEPTTGLHLSDIDTLQQVFDRLLDHGNTVVVIEHNLDVIATADWIIDLGPGPGRRGGRILCSGTPEEIRRCTSSETARALRDLLAPAAG